jgi:hypothetical protein
MKGIFHFRFEISHLSFQKQSRDAASMKNLKWTNDEWKMPFIYNLPPAPIRVTDNDDH